MPKVVYVSKRDAVASTFKPTGKAAINKIETAPVSKKKKAQPASKPKMSAKKFEEVHSPAKKRKTLAVVKPEPEPKPKTVKLGYFPAPKMALQEGPFGKKGPFCLVLFPHVFERMVDTGAATKEYLSFDKEVTVEVNKPVLVKKSRLGLQPQFVRVLKGDERNGVGVLVQQMEVESVRVLSDDGFMSDKDAEVLARGTLVRFAGGSAYSYAKAAQIGISPEFAHSWPKLPNQRA